MANKNGERCIGRCNFPSDAVVFSVTVTAVAVLLIVPVIGSGLKVQAGASDGPPEHVMLTALPGTVPLVAVRLMVTAAADPAVTVTVGLCAATASVAA